MSTISTNSQYEEHYTDAELVSIIDQGMIYMCACPAQVADSLRNLRTLIRYQLQCITDPDNNTEVHTTIANSTIEAHKVMQDCLDKVVELEEWERNPLRMPENLRKRQMNEMLAN